MKFRILIEKFAGDGRGTAAIEYALAAALLGMAILTSATSLGSKMTAMFTSVGSGLASDGISSPQ